MPFFPPFFFLLNWAVYKVSYKHSWMESISKFLQPLSWHLKSRKKCKLMVKFWPHTQPFVKTNLLPSWHHWGKDAFPLNKNQLALVINKLFNAAFFPLSTVKHLSCICSLHYMGNVTKWGGATSQRRAPHCIVKSCIVGETLNLQTCLLTSPAIFKFLTKGELESYKIHCDGLYF